MKIAKFLAVALCLAAVATSCKTPDEPTPNTEGKQINVQAQMYNFTRATDTAFEEGDQIGLHILTPDTWLDNALYTYTAGKLVGEQTNLWYTDEELEADVVAYYPYNANGAYNAAGYTFTVNADQNSAKAYTASDLMVATTTSCPTAEAVTLPFRHALSKVVVRVDNQLGEDIAAVWFSGVYGTTTVNLLDGTSAASGSKGTIKAANVTVDGAQAWALILVPQEGVTPQLIVTTASEKQYTFSISAPATFSAGKVSTAEVSLTKESIATDFTPTISDWEADNDLQFNQSSEGEDNGENGENGDNGENGENGENGDNEEGKDDAFVPTESGLGVVGSFAASGWSADVALMTTPKEGMLVAENINFAAGDTFKIRTVGAWDQTNIGASVAVTLQANTYATGANGSNTNFAVKAEGVYDIYFYQPNLTVYLMEDGNDYTEATEQEVVAPEVEFTNNKLYLAPNSNWKQDGARFAAYFFNEAGDVYVWVDMTDEDADKTYECYIPKGDYTKIIFCRMNPSKTLNIWDNKWNQSADLTIPTDGNDLYTIAEGAWDQGDGTWSRWSAL